MPEVEDHSDRPEIIAALSEGSGRSRRHSSTIDRDLVYLAAPLGTLENPKGTVRVAVPITEIEESISQIHGLIWLASGLGFLLVLLIGFFASRPMTRRLHEIAETAKSFAKGDFSRKINVETDDELGDLGTALNQTADDLQKYVSQITRERDQLQAILNSMVEGVMVTSLDGRILLSNASFQNIFGLHEPILQKSISEVIREPQLIEALELAISKKEDVVETIELPGPFRKSLEAHVSILGSNEKPSGTVVVFHDVTQLNHLEKVRRDFVANVSHEIRTPITAIKGYVETILENGSLQESKSREFLQTILRNTERMTKLVDDLLRLSKLESIELAEIQMEEVDLAKTIDRVVEGFRNIEGTNRITFTVNRPDKIPKVKGMILEIETALENLIDNSTKYGAEAGEVTIAVKEHETEVQVDVSDQGIGIPVEDQPRIFERFYRVDKARSRALGGTGLGLSIVKHIIQRHGGRLWVESEVGRGSTFSFTLPKA